MEKFYIHLGIQAHICIVLWLSLHVSEGRNDYKVGNTTEFVNAQVVHCRGVGLHDL